mmetsp:Transcript_12172/g.26861  ORF Transcript_12172/g.26861 Transcript_12172/m.26861 type:complete len:93 (-) Transcript_12172:65-343(-)
MTITFSTPTNQKLFDVWDAAALNTDVQVTIQPYRRTKDGKEAYFVLKRQYAGEETHQREFAAAEAQLRIRWNGINNYPLYCVWYTGGVCAAH